MKRRVKVFIRKILINNSNEPKLVCNEYYISNAEQLLWFAKRVNSGDIEIKGKLLDDIDISDKNDFIGIGTNQYPYRGIFDGNGFCININLNVLNDHPALFGIVAGNAVIKNLRVTGIINTQMKFISGIVSKIQSNSAVTIKECQSEVKLVYFDK